MIKGHTHRMRNLEQLTEHPEGNEMNIYNTWCCVDRDCDYHELRFMEIKDESDL